MISKAAIWLAIVLMACSCSGAEEGGDGGEHDVDARMDGDDAGPVGDDGPLADGDGEVDAGDDGDGGDDGDVTVDAGDGGDGDGDMNDEDAWRLSLRVITYNVFGGTAWPANRPAALEAVANGTLPGMLAAELSLYDPDIIGFSESPSEEFALEVASILGLHHVRFPSPGDWPGTILSRYEIVESENCPLGEERPPHLFTRHWGRAVVRLPDGEEIVIHSAHLYPTGDPTIRLEEIPAMLETMQADFAAGRSMLLLGDFNHVPDTAEHDLWTDAGWVDSFEAAGTGSGHTYRADILHGQIDYVMAAGPLASLVVEARSLFEGAFRLDINDPEAIALSDHLPMLAVFEEPD